jgi:hypothetical protein
MARTGTRKKTTTTQENNDDDVQGVPDLPTVSGGAHNDVNDIADVDREQPQQVVAADSEPQTPVVTPRKSARNRIATDLEKSERSPTRPVSAKRLMRGEQNEGKPAKARLVSDGENFTYSENLTERAISLLTHERNALERVHRGHREALGQSQGEATRNGGRSTPSSDVFSEIRRTRDSACESTLSQGAGGPLS